MLKVGINWLSPYTLPIVHRLLDEGIADFCEIMVDNAVHLSPLKIREALPDVPLALHIVTSSFLTKSPDDLQDMAQHLRPWIAELQPLYVSDHLPQLNYQTDFVKTAERVSQWQDLLGMRLLLENFPSMSAAGAGQAEFYARLMQETKCELLFDFSNAYIAEYNLGLSSRKALFACPGSIPNLASLQQWEQLLNKTKHFHVAGFRIDPKTKLATDTHDVPIADEVMAMMQAYFSNFAKTCERSIVFELDAKLDYELAKEQITRLRTALSGAANGSASLSIAGRRDPRKERSASTGMYVPKIESDALPLAAPLYVAPKANLENSAKEKMIAEVTDWSLRGLDHIPAKGIIMRTRDYPDMAVGLWKSIEPDQPAKIVTLDITALNLPPTDAYAISHQMGSWAGVEWADMLDF